MDLLRGLVLRGLKPKPEPERGRSQTERSRRRRSLLTRPRNGKRRQVPGSVLHGVHAPGGAAGNVKHQLHRYVLAMDAIHREEKREKNGSSGSGGGASPGPGAPSEMPDLGSPPWQRGLRTPSETRPGRAHAPKHSLPGAPGAAG